ncbi:MAG: hypothetical protein ACXWQE_07425 [Bdellovibrionales bacterium]
MKIQPPLLVGLFFAAVFWAAGAVADLDSESSCVKQTARVTQYFTKHVASENDRACKKGGEGTCRFTRGNVTYIKTVDEAAIPVDNTPCKFGRGKNDICLSPCTTVAADLTKHSVGDIIYFPKLKGTKCSDGSVNKDGKAVVIDSGDAFKKERRGANEFDFFIGDCKNVSGNNECLDAENSDVEAKLKDQSLEYCTLGRMKLQKDSAPDMASLSSR